MRLLVLTTNRHFQSLLEEILLQYGLMATPVTLRAAREDREQPVVLLHAERWDGYAASLVGRLLEATPHVYVICPQAADLRTVIAILKTDAADASADTALALHALALKLRQVMRVPEPGRWQLRNRYFVPADGCLYARDERRPLTPTEVRLLRRLCLASASEPPRRLTVAQLAQELRKPGNSLASRESAVRTYVANLRRKLGDSDPPTLLCHDDQGYWVALGPPSS